MTPLFAVLLHGDEMDLIYFWSSIIIVLLPLGVFAWLSYLVVRAYRREQGSRSREPGPGGHSPGS
jgi:peptidoglycan/LPS O-acetylase OafA/YrhL